MNLDLYTDEFRNFKFLKNSPEFREDRILARKSANLIRPRDNEDITFEWKTRLEFCEQLLDLRHEKVYVVFAGDLNNPCVIEMDMPIILTENPIIYNIAREATFDDIPLMEDGGCSHFCLCEEKSFADPRDLSTFGCAGKILRLGALPIVPCSEANFTELFYLRESAEMYKRALTDFIRYQMSAMSAITARF